MSHIKSGVALLDAADACAAGVVVLESITDSMKLTSTQKRNIKTLCETIKKASEVVSDHAGATCGGSTYAQQRFTAERRKKLRAEGGAPQAEPGSFKRSMDTIESFTESSQTVATSVKTNEGGRSKKDGRLVSTRVAGCSKNVTYTSLALPAPEGNFYTSQEIAKHLAAVDKPASVIKDLAAESRG